MQELNLFLIFIQRLNTLHARYMVTGSVASMLYGEPRITHDVDIVLEIGIDEAKRLGELFPGTEFYCPPYEIVRAEISRENRGHFNLIHHETGFKADMYLSGDDPLHQWAFEHAIEVVLDAVTVSVAPAEYVILKKLLYFREGGSEKHLRDIHAMLRVSSAAIDLKEIERWVTKLGLAEQWKLARRNTT